VCQKLKEFADRHRASVPQNGGPASMQVNAAAGPSNIPISQPTPQSQPNSQGTTQPGFKTGPEPVLGADTSNSQNVYPISATLNTTNPGPVQWASAQQGRPTLTGGIAGGRVSGSCVYGVLVILHSLIDPRRDSGSGCAGNR
jgi:transcription initiation factor TFIID subunit 12